MAGKTGTAQEVGGACNCYQDGGLDVSFAGFAPADKPRFTVYVVVKHPGDGASGGGTAGPVFRKILTYVLQKYAVPPTGHHAAEHPDPVDGRTPIADSLGRVPELHDRSLRQVSEPDPHPPDVPAPDPAGAGGRVDRGRRCVRRPSEAVEVTGLSLSSPAGPAG